MLPNPPAPPVRGITALPGPVPPGLINLRTEDVI